VYTSVKKLLDEGLIAKWVKVTDEEIQCIVDSIPGENMVRNAHHNRMNGEASGDNLRHHIDRGYIVVVSTFSKEAEKHPLDTEERKLLEQKLKEIGEQNISVKSEPGVFATH